MRLALQLAVVLGAGAAVTLLAVVAGAPNLGTALTFGQIAFAVALIAVLLRSSGEPAVQQGDGRATEQRRDRNVRAQRERSSRRRRRS